MATETNISWCDSTFNPWIGCTKISPACDNCYAEVSTPSRTMGIEWGNGKPRHRTSPKNWGLPIDWHNGHAEFFAAHQRRRRVFCASLADVFDNQVDKTWREDLFTMIELTTNLDWLILTKRIGNTTGMFPGWFYGSTTNLQGIWLGISVVNQHEFDRDISALIMAPADIRFLSIEPMLGPITIPEPLGRCIDWVIVGGESGRNARPMQKDWVKSLICQCAWYGIPLFFKQWGGTGRDKGGSLFDGIEIKNFPKPKPCPP